MIMHTISPLRVRGKLKRNSSGITDRTERRQKMDLKKIIIAAALISTMVFAAVGCSSDTGATTVVQQPTQTAAPTTNATQTPPSNNNVGQTPPSDNSTMPAPPEGGIQGERPAMPEIDYAAAAATLGVTEEQLKAALGDMEQGPTDIAAAAQQLGVSEDALREALGIPAGGPPQGGPPAGSAAPPVSGSETY
jgi:hypothetical protein